MKTFLTKHREDALPLAACESESRKEPVLFKKIGVGLATLGAISFGVYLRFIRPWQLRWGATDDEVASAMPGDVER